MERQTFWVTDGSDGPGLVIGQQVNVNGWPGRWRVVLVHPPRGRDRAYDVIRLPNRRSRRHAASSKRRR